MLSIRRHRRFLLLPPGLLALASLLLLGCLMINRNSEQLRPRYALQITMPPLQPGSQSYPRETYLLTPAALDAFRPWQTLKLTGAPWPDYFSIHAAQTITRQLHDDPDHDRGLRIHFTGQATYAQVVQMLDLFNGIGLKKYWLDIRHEPTTLYTFTSKPRFLPGQILALGFDCGTGYLTRQPPDKGSFWLQVDTYLTTLRTPATYAVLQNPDWRSSLHLMLLLAVISLGRIFRQWRRA